MFLWLLLRSDISGGFVIGVVLLDINSNADTPSRSVSSRSLANNFAFDSWSSDIILTLELEVATLEVLLVMPVRLDDTGTCLSM